MQGQDDDVVDFLPDDEAARAIERIAAEGPITASAGEGLVAEEAIGVEAGGVGAVHGFVVVQLAKGEHDASTRGEGFPADDGGGRDGADGGGGAGEAEDFVEEEFEVRAVAVEIGGVDLANPRESPARFRRGSSVRAGASGGYVP